jgi:23S rRNA (guanosine2251-2'-O)-methyltransferase
MQKKTSLIQICGIQSVELAIQKENHTIDHILFAKSTHQPKRENMIALCKEKGIHYEIIEATQLDKISDHPKHQGVLAFSKKQNTQSLGEYLNNIDQHRILILDRIQDPHNLGACIRTAAALSMSLIIIPKHLSCPINATVRKVACGGDQVIPILTVNNLSQCIEKLKQNNIWIYASSEHAKVSLYQLAFAKNFALIMGSEGSGVKQKLQENADYLFSIPTNKALSSLNVSVATGICLFEAKRQLNLLDE